MSYAVAADLIGRFGAEEIAQRADREIPRLVTAELLSKAVTGGDTSEASEEELAALDKALAVIDESLEDADNLINTYLARRYTVPVANGLPALRRFACDIARYNLYEDLVTENIENRYKAAVRFLREVAEGTVNLGDPAAAPAPTNDLPQVVSDPLAFSRQSSKGFI